MHPIDIKSLDLNLLIALKALLEEKHVTRAAYRVGLSQPAMSRALARLRIMFKDPLLVKTAGGFGLSARGSEIYQPLLQLFTDLNQIISPPASDPAAMTGEIVIATRDNEMVAILPGVINYLSQNAPGLTLRVLSFTGDNLNLLEDNQVDFIITGSESNSSNLFRSVLYKEDHVCLVAADNPLAKKFTLENFAKMDHCLVSISGFGPGRVDKFLAEKGLKRNITVRVPHFFAAALIVASTNLVVTLPRRVGMALLQMQKVKLLPPPLKIPSFPIYLYWHVRNQNNPVHKWLRRVIPEHC